MIAAKGRKDNYGDAAMRADDLLSIIAAATRGVEALTGEYNAALERLTAEYDARLSPLREELAAAEKALRALMKTSRATLFAGGDIVYLSNGTLVYHKDDRLVIPRNHDSVIAACEALGYDDVVKVSKSLDREALNRWPDDQLALVGLHRKPREQFSWKVPGV